MRAHTLRDKVMRGLRARGYKVVSYRPGEVGTPDLIGCGRGQMFLIELKAGDDKLSPIQRQRLVEWASAGATTEVMDEHFGLDEFCDLVRGDHMCGCDRMGDYWKIRFPDDTLRRT